jgi:hypothetical protein
MADLDREKERPAFEAWARSIYVTELDRYEGWGNTADYGRPFVEAFWKAWLARAALAALPKGEPVAWRVRVTDNGRTMYAYTERLPFEPMEGSGVKVRSEPEPLFLAAPPAGDDND